MAVRRRLAVLLAALVGLAGSVLPLATGVGASPAAAATPLGRPVLGPSTALPGMGNTESGQPTGTQRPPVICPSGQVLTTLTGWRRSDTTGDTYLRGVQASCAPVQSDGTSASLGAATLAGSIGHVDDAYGVLSNQSACPAGWLATGVRGAIGLLVDYQKLYCAPLNADGTLGEATFTDGLAGSSAGGTLQPDQLCPQGSVVTGMTGYSGDGLDFLALQCAPLTFAVDKAVHFTAGVDQFLDVQPRYQFQVSDDLGVDVDVRWDGNGTAPTDLRGIFSVPVADGQQTEGGPFVYSPGYELYLEGGRPCFRVTSGLVKSSTCMPSPLPVDQWVRVHAAYQFIGAGHQVTVAVNGATVTGRFANLGPVTFTYTNFTSVNIGRLSASEAPRGDALTTFSGDLDNLEVTGLGEGSYTIADFRFDEGSGEYAYGAAGQISESTPIAYFIGQANVPQPPTWVDHGFVDLPNVIWPTAMTVRPNAQVDSAILTPGESRWFRFPVAPDGKVQVDITGLPDNYDAILFKDIGQAFTSLLTTKDLTRLSAEFAGDAFAPSVFSPSVFSPSVFSPSVFSPSVFSPSVFSPSVFSPSVFSPSVFSPSVFSPSVFSPSVFSPSVFSPSVFSPSVFSPSVFSPSVFSPSVFSPSVFSPDQFAQAWSSAQTRSAIAVSAKEGLADESVASNVWDNTGYFYVLVTGRNGANSPAAFQVKVTSTNGACPVLDTAAAATTIGGTPGPATVILTDSTRFGSADAQAITTLQGKLTSLANATNGVVVDLSQSAKVRALNTQADNVPQCPYAKNLVAQAARDVVNSYRGPNLKYVVLAGGDGVVPFFRYPDAAGLGPENGYVPPVADSTASQGSLRRNTFLSQDAYGAAVDVSLKGSKVPVPDLSVGRLVEAPSEIGGTIDNYLALNGGTLPTASSSLVTGYDFLTDAADNVARTLGGAIGGAKNDTLITNQGVPPTTTTGAGGPSRTASWTAPDLKAALLAQKHDVTFLAGHFSANSTLAADYSTQLITTELQAPSVPADLFKNTLVFSAGCHSGYNLLDGDGIPQVTLGLDWAQLFAQKGATLVAGTGYQYGDTDFVEYSERLYGDFAKQLSYGSNSNRTPVAVGDALTRAKQTYLADTAELKGIHVKALMEATLFGLPMLGVDLPNRTPAPSTSGGVTLQPAPSGTPGAVLGLQTADLSLNATTTPVTVPLNNGSVTATYLQGPNGIVTNPAAPTLPLVSQDVTAPGGANAPVLRGVGFRGGSYTDTDGITPLTGAPATELNNVHAPFVSSAFYPNRLATPNYFGALSGTGGTRLSITPAQYRSDAQGSLTDTQRRYGSVDYQLFYSNNTTTYGANKPALAAPPSFTLVDATAAPAGSPIPVSVRVVGDPSAGVQKVWVTYTGEGSHPFHGTWASVDLTQDGVDSTLWKGFIPASTGNASDVRFLVQAANGVGLVGAQDNNGKYWTPGATAPSFVPVGTSTLTVSPSATSGAYGTSVSVTATLTGTGPDANSVLTTGPLANRFVTFHLGTSAATVATDSAGHATASLPLLDLPGSYPLQASFEGDPDTATVAFAAASSTPQSVTITKQATALALGGSPATLTEQDTTTSTGITATLTDTARNLPVREKAVYFTLTNATTGAFVAAATRTTNFDGVAALGPLNAVTGGLPVGTYSVKATFAGQVALPGGATTTLSDDTYSGSTSGTGTLTVRSAAVAPTITGIAPATAVAGTVYGPFSYTVTGTPAPTVTLASGTLPTGITLSTAGVLSGTPTVAGTFTFTVKADNGTAPAATTPTQTITVAPGAANDVQVNGGNAQAGTAGQPFGTPLSVVVKDQYGNPVPNQSVTFTVATGAAKFGTATTAVATTNAAGIATAPTLTAGKTAGTVTVTAALTGSTTVPSATFTETVLSVTTARADLKIAITGVPATAPRGSQFTATITVTNAGPNAASTMITGVDLGPGLTVVSASTGATIGYLKGSAVWTASGLASGAKLTYTVTVKAANPRSAFSSNLTAGTVSIVPDPALTSNATSASIRLT